MSKAGRNARYYAKRKELLAQAQDRATKLSAENLALRQRLKSPEVIDHVATDPGDAREQPQS